MWPLLLFGGGVPPQTGGFVKLPRRLRVHDYFRGHPERLGAMLDLYLDAEWRTDASLPRGSLSKSWGELASQWGWSRSAVRRFLDQARRLGEIAVDSVILSGADKAQTRLNTRHTYHLTGYDLADQLGAEAGTVWAQTGRSDTISKKEEVRSEELLPIPSPKLPARQTATAPVPETLELTPLDLPEPKPNGNGHPRKPRGSKAGVSGNGEPTGLEKWSKAECDVAYENWIQEVGAVNYGRLRRALLPCHATISGQGSVDLTEAIKRFGGAIRGASERERGFMTVERFAGTLTTWVHGGNGNAAVLLRLLKQ